MALITSDCDAMHSLRIEWTESPRIVMRCTLCASNGPNHLGLCAGQVRKDCNLPPDALSDDELEELFCMIDTDGSGGEGHGLHPRSLWTIPTAAVS